MSDESAETLETRLRAIREARAASALAPTSAPPTPAMPASTLYMPADDRSYDIDDELEELQSMISDSSYLAPSQRSMATIATANTADGVMLDVDEPAMWADMRPTARSYVEEDVEDQATSTKATLERHGGVGPGMKRGPSLPAAPNAHGNVSYESAFRLIQQAAEAVRSADPLLAIQLYTDAGDLLVRVGKTESDPLLRQGINEKATEIMKRAEELDQWYYSLQENIRKAALPPQLKIQKTAVPRVQQSWHARRPPYSHGEEFTHMRYTAVTTRDPYHFAEDGYHLRVEELQHKVRTFITITMYNEEGAELRGTLTGIARNLEYMCELWGDKAWETVAVAVVSDGRTKASASCLDFLTSLGAFDEEIMTVTSVGVDVQLHFFESTIQLIRDNFEAYYPPIQLVYGLKEHNGGKLNSHLWFFNAFSEHLLPMYTVLIDVGTIPGPDSIYRLVRTMDRNHQIGGVAGEIAVEKPNYFNPVVAAQHFE